MVALLVILTFAVALLADHLLTRKPIPVAVQPPLEDAQRPRLTPSVVAGFEVPDNLRYHPGHTWAVPESRDLVRIGIDDFAAKLAGSIDTINVPERGMWIRQGQRIIAMRHGGRELDLVSPIEGTIVDINQNALDHPELAKSDPYGEGWLLTVNAPDSRTNFRNLLGGTLARRWMDDSAAKLRSAITPEATAQEGGTAVGNAIDHVSDAEWPKLLKEVFLI